MNEERKMVLKVESSRLNVNFEPTDERGTMNDERKTG